MRHGPYTQVRCARALVRTYAIEGSTSNPQTHTPAVRAPRSLASRLHVRRLCYIMNVVLYVPTSKQVEAVATPDRGSDQCRRAFS
jgi:hypothetical protein